MELSRAAVALSAEEESGVSCSLNRQSVQMVDVESEARDVLCVNSCAASVFCLNQLAGVTPFFTLPFRICMIVRINFNRLDDNLKAVLPPVETISQINLTVL